jgi:hypothetical protein
MNEPPFCTNTLSLIIMGGIENIRILGVNKEINRTIMGGVNSLRSFLTCGALNPAGDQGDA